MIETGWLSILPPIIAIAVEALLLVAAVLVLSISGDRLFKTKPEG